MHYGAIIGMFYTSYLIHFFIYFFPVSQAIYIFLWKYSWQFYLPRRKHSSKKSELLMKLESDLLHFMAINLFLVELFIYLVICQLSYEETCVLCYECQKLQIQVVLLSCRIILDNKSFGKQTKIMDENRVQKEKKKKD